MSSATDTEALIAQLHNVEGKAEIVGGEIVIMSPASRRHGRVSRAIVRSLEAMEQQLGGCAYGDNVGFLVDLPNRTSFSPDVAFCLGPPPEEDDFEFGSSAPEFAVEIRSKYDYGADAERRLAEKRADYFAAGTQVVWDVDLKGDDVIRVYRATDSTEPTIYRRSEVAEAEPAVPGWTMPVDEIFE